jgi:hypothetical protein
MTPYDNAPSSQAGSKIKNVFMTLGSFILGLVIRKGCCCSQGKKVKKQRETAL